MADPGMGCWLATLVSLPLHTGCSRRAPYPQGWSLAPTQPCSLSFPRGSAYAVTVSYFVQIIFLFLYIVLKKLHLETWAGAGGCPAFGELGRPAAGRTPARAQGVHSAGGQRPGGAPLEEPCLPPASRLPLLPFWAFFPFAPPLRTPPPDAPDPPIKCDMVESPAGTASGSALAGSLISGW